MSEVRDMMYDRDALMCNCPSDDSEIYELEDKIQHLEARVAALEKCIGILINENCEVMSLFNVGYKILSSRIDLKDTSLHNMSLYNDVSRG